MTNLKQYKILFYDYGGYVSVAERLGREDGFDEVFYYIPKVHNSYPTHKEMDIGRGVPNITVVKEWADVIGQVQAVYFADSHEPAFQQFCVSIGKLVFGSRYGCNLEHDRKGTKELMTELGLPVNDYEVALGMDELEEILKTKEDVYVKSSLRGDMETWFHQNYALSKAELLRMRNELGTYYNRETYIIEDLIKSLAEIGWDGWIIDGIPVQIAYTGIELKDVGYAGKVTKYKDLPRQLRLVTDKFYSTFASLNYRGAYSNEVIIDEKLKGYLLDTTARCPQPNTDLAIETFTNYPQMVWDIMNGIIPTPEYKYEWGVQFIIKSEIAKKEPSEIQVPDEYKQNVKLKNLTIDENGTWFYTPLSGVEMCEIGSVVYNAATLRQAINGATKIAESIKGFDIKINTDCIDKAMEQINNLKKNGINYLNA